jgi:hypothetical protein
MFSDEQRTSDIERYDETFLPFSPGDYRIFSQKRILILFLNMVFHSYLVFVIQFKITVRTSTFRYTLPTPNTGQPNIITICGSNFCLTFDKTVHLSQQRSAETRQLRSM